MGAGLDFFLFASALNILNSRGTYIMIQKAKVSFNECKRVLNLEKLNEHSMVNKEIIQPMNGQSKPCQENISSSWAYLLLYPEIIGNSSVYVINWLQRETSLFL